MRHRNRPGRQPTQLQLMRMMLLHMMKSFGTGTPKSKRRNRGIARRRKIAAIQRNGAIEKLRLS